MGNKWILSSVVTLLAVSNVASGGSIKKGSAGCGKHHNSGFYDGVDDHTITSGGLQRNYAVYVPKDYNDNPNRPRKVVFDYHGNNGTPRNQWNNSQYFKYPDGESYLGIYPAGFNKSWQSAPYAVAGVNDLQFTTDLLAHIKNEYCVDTDHVYASGKSNGGGFVDYLACSSNGDEFAAFALAGAAMYSDNSLNDFTCGNKKRAIIEAHGQNDTTVSYYGGPRLGGHLPDIRTWVGWWAQRDGCDPVQDAAESGDLGGYQVISYSCRGLRSVVQHYSIFDLGHCWPSSTGDNSDGTRDYCDDHSLDYTPVVLGFFSKWSLKNAPC